MPAAVASHRAVRAPRAEGDFLTAEQVVRCLAPLRPADAAALHSADFAVRAREAFAAASPAAPPGAEGAAGAGPAGGEGAGAPLAVGAGLCAAIAQAASAAPLVLRDAAAVEFADPASLAHAVRAFRRLASAGAGGADGLVHAEDFPSFVRFCLAYRIHCYFETSRLQPVAVPDGQPPSVVFVLGGPGAGKGTMCARAAAAFGYQPVSTGHLLREAAAAGGERAQELQRLMREGGLAPTEFVLDLLMQRLAALGWEGGRFLIDGFPRSLANLEAWQARVGARATVKLCVFLECSEGVMEARVIERGKTSGRADDNLESIRQQFATFYHDSSPVVEAFRAQGVLRRLDAERSVEAVWADVEALFGPDVVFVLGAEGAGASAGADTAEAEAETEAEAARCERVAQHFGYQRLRAHTFRGGLGGRGEGAGSAAEAEATVRALRAAMEERGWESGKYLVEDFPRTPEELEAYHRIVGRRATVRFTLLFDRPEGAEVAVPARALLERLRAQPGGLRRVDAGAARGAEAAWQDVRRLFGPSVVLLFGEAAAGLATQGARVAEAFNLRRLRLVELRGAEDPAAPEAPEELVRRALEERGWEGGRYLLEAEAEADREEAVPFAWAARLAGAASGLRVEAALLLERGGGQAPAAAALPPVAPPAALAAAPSLRELEADGLLRRIDAEQDVEEAWRCTQEVLRLELDSNLRNHAMLLLKPHACNADTDRFLRSHLASRGVAVVLSGSTSVAEVMGSGKCFSPSQRSLFDQQYAQILCAAATDPRELEVSDLGRQRFKEGTGVAWDEALRAGLVRSAKDALVALGLEPAALAARWRAAAASVRLGYAASAAEVAGLYVVNGFAPHWRETFGQGADHLRWYVVEFSPERLPWRRFRADVLGATNPTEATANSVRGQLWQHWERLGLPEAPDTINNCLHASTGPLEGLRECLLWARAGITELPLGRSLLAAGVPQETLEAWLANERVEGWRCPGRAPAAGPIFAVTEGCDHGDLRAAALRYLRATGVPLRAWLVEDAPRPLALGRFRRQVRQVCHRLRKNEAMHPGELASESLARPQELTLLHFNDVYNVEPRKKEPVGGIARFVTRVRGLKAEAVARGEPPAMCLFSGDAFNPSPTSTVTKGRHMVPALNAIGIDTACYGNHDFDFGVDELAELAGQCEFPWLISNVVDKASGAPLANGLLTLMIDWHGRKIGFMGLIEREWLVTLHTIEPEDVVYEDFCVCARRLAKQLRQEGADLVLALTHMRVPNDELLAREVAELDLILGGHDHHYDVKPVGPFGTYILKSGTDFRDLTVLRLRFHDAAAESKTGPPQRTFEVLEARHVEVDSSVAEDPSMKALVDDCSRQVGAAMDKVIGETAVDLDCRFSSIRTAETNIGNFVCDVMRSGLRADVAFVNSGTLRADAVIEQGPLRMRDLLGVLPMLDELCLLELSGDQLVSVLQNSVSQYPRLEGRFLQVSGVNFSFAPDRAPGTRLEIDSVRVGSQGLDLARRYKVCTLNYLRQGKDGFDVLRGAMCLADGEQAGILPTMVREHLLSLSALNGLSELGYLGQPRLQRAASVLQSGDLVRVGEGPEPTRRFAIGPRVEGRIVCLPPGRHGAV